MSHARQYCGQAASKECPFVDRGALRLTCSVGCGHVDEAALWTGCEALLDSLALGRTQTRDTRLLCHRLVPTAQVRATGSGP